MRKWLLWHAAVIGLAIGVLFMIGVPFMHRSAARTPVAFAWLQYTPGGVEARVVTRDPACPPVTFGDRVVPMSVRARAGPDYPVTTCAASVPVGTPSARIDGVALTLAVADPKRILLIADTGCRMKGTVFQACNDPAAWPARQLAAAATRLAPDLVIHAGDYHYRETPCPRDVAGCAGSPVGDTWDVWQADFFEPFAPLLQAAPWIAVRGNHEECGRGGIGWSRTLEPHPFDAGQGCNGLGATYTVELPGLTLAVLDVSTAAEGRVDAAQAAHHRERYAELDRLPPGPLWILQHRPIWSAGYWENGQPKGDNKTLAAAATGNIPSRVAMMISGHHHLFQALAYERDLPVQIVAGHGGDLLNKPGPRGPVGLTVGDVRIRAGVEIAGAFGFVMLTRMGEGWRVTNHDVTGAVVGTCDVHGRKLTCETQ